MEIAVIRRRVKETKQVTMTVDEYRQITHAVEQVKAQRGLTLLHGDSLEFTIETEHEEVVYVNEDDEDDA